MTRVDIVMMHHEIGMTAPRFGEDPAEGLALEQIQVQCDGQHK